MNKFYTTVIFFAFFTSVFYLKKINAQDFSAFNHEVKLEVQENGNAIFKSEILLQNNDNSYLIEGYQYILPTSKAQIATVAVDNKVISSPIYRHEDENSVIDISLGESAIKPNESKLLKINTIIPGFIKEKYTVKYLLLRAGQDNANKYTLTFPKSFGLPVFISTRNYRVTELENTYSIEFFNVKPTFITWGDRYFIDIESKVIINNEQHRELASYFQILSSNKSQKVIYKKIFSGEYGIEDKFLNRYAYIKAKGNSSIEAGYEAKVFKEVNNLNIKIDRKYNLNWEEGGEITKKFNEIISGEDDLLSIVEFVNKKLISNYPVEFTSAKPFTDPKNHWEVLDNKTSFNSFDYCFLLTSLIEKLGGKVEVRYGYVVISDFEDLVIQPHFWIVTQINQNTILVDPYQQVISNIDYFGSENDFDRITVGVWHPEINTFGSLGLIDNNEKAPVKKISIKNYGDFVNAKNTIQPLETKIKEVFSGFYYSLELPVENKTNNFIKIKNIFVNNNDHLLSYIPKEFTLGLLPNKINTIKITGLRYTNFLLTGQRKDVINIKLEDRSFNDIAIPKDIILKINTVVYLFLPIIIFASITIFIYIKKWKSN